MVLMSIPLAVPTMTARNMLPFRLSMRMRVPFLVRCRVGVWADVQSG